MMRSEWEHKPMWRHSIWQAQSPAAPRRWPLKLSLLLLTTLCVALWALLGGAIYSVVT